jgi:hypothetical protein
MIIEPTNRWIINGGINLSTLEMIFASLREKGHVLIELDKSCIPPTIAALLPEMEIKHTT